MSFLKSRFKIFIHHVPENKDELRAIIYDKMLKEGPDCDLNDIDVSKVEDLSFLFAGSDFCGTLHHWKVGHVTNMSHMFTNSTFDDYLDGWEVRKVKNMEDMFKGSPMEGREPTWYDEDLVG